MQYKAKYMSIYSTIKKYFFLFVLNLSMTEVRIIQNIYDLLHSVPLISPY